MKVNRVIHSTGPSNIPALKKHKNQYTCYLVLFLFHQRTLNAHLTLYVLQLA